MRRTTFKNILFFFLGLFCIGIYQYNKQSFNAIPQESFLETLPRNNHKNFTNFYVVPPPPSGYVPSVYFSEPVFLSSFQPTSFSHHSYLSLKTDKSSAGSSQEPVEVRDDAVQNHTYRGDIALAINGINFPYPINGLAKDKQNNKHQFGGTTQVAKASPFSDNPMSVGPPVVAAPLPPDTPVPLDSGTWFVIIAGVITALGSLYRGSVKTLLMKGSGVIS